MSDVVVKKELNKACCGKCDYILAMTTRDELTIHYRELYFYLYGGLIIIICNGCGSPNYIVDEEYERLHPEQVAKVRAMVNMQVAVFKKWIHREPFETRKNGGSK